MIAIRRTAYRSCNDELVAAYMHRISYTTSAAERSEQHQESLFRANPEVFAQDL
jgi:hypothetical protein